MMEQRGAALERKAREQLAARDYEGILDTMAAMAEARIYSPEVFYAGAYAYFMQGDYQRAATWVNNTLTYAPGHVPARILLARLCILEDRTAEALSVLDVLLEMGNIEEKEMAEIREIAGYYGRTRREMVCRDYPHIAAFLRLEKSGTEGRGEPAGGRILERKAELPSAAVPGDEAMEAARRKVEEVLGMACSAKEKVQILCSFAGAWYFGGDFGAAEMALKAAGRIDSDAPEVFRGLALVAVESGDLDKAVQYASHIRPTDFLLLRTIREAKK
ncbi:MAG: tetratricopeptide repeat protein [Selenomonadaceae bacterium]|nr:tetratricopeptide repeat protein [Selenomonadaceae bacterium]